MEMNSPGRAKREMSRSTAREDPPFKKLFLISHRESLLFLGNDGSVFPILSHPYGDKMRELAKPMSAKVGYPFMNSEEFFGDLSWMSADHSDHGLLSLISLIVDDIRYLRASP